MKVEKFGILALNINDTKEHKIINKLINDLNQLDNIKFLGIIYYGNPMQKTYIHQPILIWEKQF